MTTGGLAWQPSLLGGDDPWVDASLTGVVRHQLDATAWVDVLPGWLHGADRVFEELVVHLPWRGGDRHMYDRVVAVPRLRAGATESILRRLPVLEDMRHALDRRYEKDFASIGFNLYRDGDDSVAWHGDKIPKEVVDPIVALVSVGEPRRFLVRPKGGGASRRFECGHGDLLVMGGSSQRTWDHCVPKVARAGPRISIAYRHVHLTPSY